MAREPFPIEVNTVRMTFRRNNYILIIVRPNDLYKMMYKRLVFVESCIF